MVVRRVLGIAGLGLAYHFCRMFPDFTAHKARAMPQRGFSHKLRTVCAFRADIFLFHFKNLAMHEAVNGTAGNTAYAFYRAGLFRRLLLCQLLPGLFQFSPWDSMWSFAAAACSCWLFCGTWTSGHFVPKCRKPPARAVPRQGRGRSATKPPPWSYSFFVSFFISSGRVVSRS